MKLVATECLDKPSTCSTYQASCSRFFDEDCFKLLADRDSEGHIHIGAVGGGNGVAVEAIRAINGLIQNLGLLFVLFLHSFNAAVAEHVAEDQATHVDGPAGGGVVHGPLHDLEIKGGRGFLPA